MRGVADQKPPGVHRGEQTSGLIIRVRSLQRRHQRPVAGGRGRSRDRDRSANSNVFVMELSLRLSGSWVAELEYGHAEHAVRETCISISMSSLLSSYKYVLEYTMDIALRHFIDCRELSVLYMYICVRGLSPALIR